MDYWNILKESIKGEDNLVKFSRSEETTLKYEKFRQDIPNIYDYLYSHLFSKGEILVFKKNDFPYKFDSNILHYIIWINPSIKKINKKKIINFLTKKLSELDQSILDYILFKNNIVNKSVESIEHYHVLIKVS